MMLISILYLFLPLILSKSCNTTCRQACMSYSSDLLCSLSCGCNYYDTKSNGGLYMIVALSNEDLQEESSALGCKYLEFLTCIYSQHLEPSRLKCAQDSGCTALVMDLPVATLENQACLDSCAKECVNAGNPSLCLKDCVLSRCNILASVTAEIQIENPKSYSILPNLAIFISISGSVIAWFYYLTFTQRRYKYSPKLVGLNPSLIS